jgi:putative phage-type endonuclease
MEQRSPEWFAARCGRVTASRIKDVLAKTKTGYSASRANYMAQLICERLTGCPSPSFTSAAMQWGTDIEPQARAAYSLHMGVDVVEVGFAPHPTIALAGASPDGLVGDDGLLEVKCPQTATHLDTLLCGEAPSDYFAQMQFQMACTGRSWCDFVSYDPRLPDHLRMFVTRVPLDTAWLAEAEAEVRKFLSEMDAKLAALSERYEQKAAA